MNEKLQALKALRAISIAIIDAVAGMGHTGAPAGIVYAALAMEGCTKLQFDNIMAGLCNAGFLRREGQVYFATGREIVAQNEPVKAGLSCGVQS